MKTTKLTAGLLFLPLFGLYAAEWKFTIGEQDWGETVYASLTNAKGEKLTILSAKDGFNPAMLISPYKRSYGDRCTVDLTVDGKSKFSLTGSRSEYFEELYVEGLGKAEIEAMKSGKTLSIEIAKSDTLLFSLEGSAGPLNRILTLPQRPGKTSKDAVPSRDNVQAASPGEPTVEANRGNIFLRSSHGDATQLTNSGRDSAPVLSPDARWIVFVRAVPGKEISTGSDDIPAAELWQISASGKDLTRLVAPRTSDNMQNVIATFSSVQFSPDGRYVFFVTPAWATSGAVHVVDTTNGKESFLMAGSGVEVIPSGEYRDCLLVGQHRYFIGGGSYDWIWLFRPDGKEIGPVGEDATNFKELYVTGTKKSPNNGKPK